MTSWSQPKKTLKHECVHSRHRTPPPFTIHLSRCQTTSLSLPAHATPAASATSAAATCLRVPLCQRLDSQPGRAAVSDHCHAAPLTSPHRSQPQLIDSAVLSFMVTVFLVFRDESSVAPRSSSCTQKRIASAGTSVLGVQILCRADGEKSLLSRYIHAQLKPPTH